MNAQARILVVDDEEIVRRSHVRVLGSVAANAVEAVGDATQALKAMESQRYDLVLLDLRMPDMDGMTVLKELKQKWPESEVIVITGYPHVDSAKEAIRLGAYDYLAKPTSPGEVINATNGALRQKQWTLRRVGHADATHGAHA